MKRSGSDSWRRRARPRRLVGSKRPAAPKRPASPRRRARLTRPVASRRPAGESQPAAAAAAPAPFERPSDEAIVAQENEIRAQIAGSAALIGEREPLSALQAVYKNEGAETFAAKAGALAKRYSALRRARGDGNCFFRSFMFALAEGLLERNDLAERNR